MDKMLRWFRKKRIAFSAHVQLITTVMIEESLGENPKQGVRDIIGTTKEKPQFSAAFAM